MYIAIDTETTGLEVRHGSKPFLISTYQDEPPPAYPNLKPDPAGGYAVNYVFDVNPLTRQPIIPDSFYEDFSNHIDGHSLVFFNAPFDITMLASIGVKIITPTIDVDELLLLEQDRFGLGSVFPIQSVGGYCHAKEIHDVSIMAHVHNNRRPQGLKDQALLHLEISDTDEKQLQSAVNKARAVVRKHFKDWKLGTNLKGDSETERDYWLPRACFRRIQDNSIPPQWDDVCERYATLDTVRTLALFYHYLNLIDPSQGFIKSDQHWNSYQTQLKLFPTLLRMQFSGLHIHPHELDSENPESLYALISNRFDHKKSLATSTASRVLKRSVNINSPIDLRELLFTRQGFNFTPIQFTEKTNEPSTNATHLTALATTLFSPENGKAETQTRYQSRTAKAFFRHTLSWDEKSPLPGENVGYGAFAAAKRYLDSYKAHAFKNYLYPSFNQVGTVWTRLSSQNPNGQNISKRPEVPLRRVFGPPSGKVWIAIDYSQLELRLFARASQDRMLLEAFEKGYDFHAYTASCMYGLSPEETPSHLRRIAKNVNFGIIYGAGPSKIATTSGDPEAYSKYSTQFSQAKSYMDKMIRSVEKCGYIETLFGYRLWVWPEPSYVAVNGIVQGTAGDLMKHAMIDLDQNNHPNAPVDWNRCKIVLNVHDELIFELDDDSRFINRTVPQLARIMAEQGLKIDAHTPVEASLIRNNWNEKESFDLSPYYNQYPSLKP